MQVEITLKFVVKKHDCTIEGRVDLDVQVGRAHGVIMPKNECAGRQNQARNAVLQILTYTGLSSQETRVLYCGLPPDCESSDELSAPEVDRLTVAENGLYRNRK